MGIGTFTQVNGIASAVQAFFDPDKANTVSIFGNDYSIAIVISAFILAILVGLVVIGGIQRISKVSQIIVPFMAAVSYTHLDVYKRQDECRELTRKYVYGLSYVNYNMLVIDWNESNASDILVPCMFDDIYRLYTGENLKPDGGWIDADKYESVMSVSYTHLDVYKRQRQGSAHKGQWNRYTTV